MKELRIKKYVNSQTFAGQPSRFLEFLQVDRQKNAGQPSKKGLFSMSGVKFEILRSENASQKSKLGKMHVRNLDKSVQN